MATAGGRPEGKRPHGRRRRSWEDTIEINPLKAKLNPICHFMALLGAHPIFHVSRIRVNLQEVECGDIDWIGVARDRDMWRAFVNVVVNIWVP